MRFGLNTLTTFLNLFGSRKVLSGSGSTHLPNIFAQRNLRVNARSRSARLRAAKSAGRLRNHRSTINPAASSTNQPSSTSSAGTAPGAKLRGTKYRNVKTRPLAGTKPLRRCNTILAPQAPTHPQPPGAFVVEPSFIVPGFPLLDDRHLPPFVVQKLFFDALDEGRQAMLRAEKERRGAEETDEEDEIAHLLEQDLKKARAAHRRAEDAEYAKLLEEDKRKAEEARRKAENEEYARLLEEDMRKAQEAYRRAMEQEERRRQAEQESMERERRERECREQEHRERERREQELRERDAAQWNLADVFRVYEEKWAMLRSNVIGTEQLGFYDIPWPLFENVQGVEDITEKRVLAFVCHPLHEHIQGPGGGHAKSVRSEMLRWHPDKFEGKVLDKVVVCDREAVKEAAGHVARILTMFSVKMR